MADEIDSAPKAKRKVQAQKIIQCVRCQCDVVTNSNGRKYCDACRAIATADGAEKSYALSRLRHKAAAAKRTFECEVCKTVSQCRRGQNKYCTDDCRRIANLGTLKVKRAGSGVRVAGSPCSRCGADMDSAHGRALYCAPCRKDVDGEKADRYRERNPEKVAERQKESGKKRAKDPRYIEWRRAYTRARGRKTPRAKLDHRVSQLIRNGLNGNKNGRTWESLVGYTIDDLYLHIERQFLPKMTWDNIGDWHVDHILPRSMFSYKTPECPDFKACWAITNLRPLWAEDNFKKSDNRTLLI